MTQAASAEELRAPARRRLLVVAALVCLPVLLLWAGARYFLASGRMIPLLTSRIEAACGAPVELDAAEVGLNGSSMRGLRLFEPGTAASEEPLLSVNDVSVDVSLWSLMGGTVAPRQMALDGVSVLLRLDSSGHLLTRLPHLKGRAESLPQSRIEHGQVVLRQEGRPDFVVVGVEAAIQASGTQLVIRGSITDPVWGQWTLLGELDLAGNGFLSLKAPAQHVTPAMLARLPFVPAKVWRHVQCDGRTPVDLSLQLDPAVKGVRYRLELAPHETRVDVTAIGLHAENARGKVIIENGIVHLHDVQGESAGGTIRTDARLDFRAQPHEMDFDIQVDQAELSRLPKKWHLPPQLTGRLTGQARLRVVIRDGKASTTGGGAGVINDAALAGLRLKKALRLGLRVDETGFHFARENPPAEQVRRLPD